MTGRIWTGATLVLAVLLGACGGGAAAPTVTRGWLRLAANPAAPAAAYFTIQGGSAPATLTGIALPMARKAEMHETMPMAQGMTGMAPLATVAVPAHATVTFAPGGRHVMLFGLDPAVKPGDRLTTSVVFAGRAPIAVPLSVVAAGDPAPY